MSYKAAYNSVHYYMSEVTSQVVVKTGIPSDRHHLGKIILHCLQSDPDFVMQIDGATGDSETNRSVLGRSVRCAAALRRRGVAQGDTLALLGANHLHLCVPHYAALYEGVAVAAIDQTLLVNELKDTLGVLKPKIIFCPSEKSADIEKALGLLDTTSIIVTFEEGSRHETLAQFLEDISDDDVNNFQPADFDPAETPAYLTSTSGTTGFPKAATLTHRNLCVAVPYLWQIFSKFPTPTRMGLVLSPIQWLSAGFQYLFSPVMKYTRLQSSHAITPDHFAYLVNKYKPTYTISSPVLMTSLLSVSARCDLTCFECVLLGGSTVPPELIEQVKAVTKAETVLSLYGLSEIGGLALQNDCESPPGSSGTALGHLEYRLVDHDTHVDVCEPNVPGELWLRGLPVFKGYYNNPDTTAETLTADGWLKTGDIFYRNEYWHFFFVERMKSLLKYRNHQVSPAEVEAVIRRHPGVAEVAVTGISDRECGDLVVACVMPKPSWTPNAQEIKDVVKESLTDSKHLRGGVIFMKELPLTSSSKINRKKLRDMVLTMERE